MKLHEADKAINLLQRWQQGKPNQTLDKGVWTPFSDVSLRRLSRHRATPEASIENEWEPAQPLRLGSGRTRLPNWNFIKMKPQPKNKTIVVQFTGGKFIASIDAKTVAFDCLSAHKAAQKAAGAGYTVKEIKNGVYRATPEGTK